MHKTSEEVVNALLEAVDAWLQTKSRGTKRRFGILFHKSTRGLLKRLQQWPGRARQAGKDPAITAMEATELVGRCLPRATSNKRAIRERDR